MTRFESLSIYNSFFNDFYYFDIDEDQVRNYRDNNEEFQSKFKIMSLQFAKNTKLVVKKKYNDESESFTPLAIRQYEAKEKDEVESLTMEDRFLIKTVDQSKNKDKKKNKRKGKKGNADVLEEVAPKTKIYNSNDFE